MKILTRALVAALLAIGIVIAVLFMEVRAQRADNVQQLARVEALEAAHGAFTRGLTAPASAGATSRDSSAAAAPPAGEAATAPEVAASSSEGNALGQMIRQTLNTEEGQKMARQAAALALGQQYPDLASALGISDEQATRLLDLLARQRTELGVERLNLTAGGQQDSAARAALARAINEKEQAHEGEVMALLGERYPQWKEYQRTAAERARETQQRMQVEQLRAAVSAPGRPVADAQFDALRAALADEERRIQTESRGIPVQQQLARLDDDNRRLLDVAARHLDPMQLESYRRHLRTRSDQMRMVLGAVGAVGLSEPSDQRPPP